jgi:integrase
MIPMPKRILGCQRGHRIEQLEWGLWRDVDRPGHYFLCYRPQGRHGPVVRRWAQVGGGLTLDRLQDKVRAARATQNAKRLQVGLSYSLPVMRDDYLDELRRLNRTPKHIAGVERALSRFLEHSGATLADRVEPGAVTRFLSSLKVEPRTQNHYRMRLLEWFGWAVTQGKAPGNPVVQTSPATIDEELVQFPMPEDMIALIDKSDPWDAALWTFAAMTGLRRGSILMLSPDRFEQEAIRVLTKRRREWYMRFDSGCPLWTPELSELGRRIWREETPTERIVQDRFTRCARRCGKAFTFHSLRHAFGSYCVMMGESLTDVAKWLDHSTQKTTEDYYVHLAPRGRDRIDENRARVFAMRSHCFLKAMA